ncbi:hypothetical protein FPZ24_16105 [Sphingomonas panacisoli]|uniref:Lipoprotein n=1 Tax=Sphingomonas panacisoli TaxID=1813879 RepID=A0A5B8LL01_9SPHN|nr:hypothetical protein [Sphingomonas panacisoli]QDZ08803.1 hypothetical protein FPZ24_16105 [Sphingomonas panacisoli]
MIVRGIFLGLLTLALGACNWIGNGYSHVVDRPQADVVAALEDLDISAQPGNPGTDPSLSGGVKPDIRLEKAADHMTWWVMAGDKVATTMTATFEQLDGGKRTRVTTSVQRGNASDDVVSPAFRSTGITSGLFSMAVEGELNKLTDGPRASAEDCQKLVEEWRMSGIEDAPRDRPENLTQAIGEGARNAIKLQAMADKLPPRRLPDGRRRRVQAGDA